MSATTIYPIKDPGERVLAEYDFSGVTASVSSPVVSVSVAWHSDTVTVDGSPSAIKDGAAQIQGAKVYQWYIGGLDLHDYATTCKATTAEGEQLVVSAILPVRDKKNLR